MASNLDIHGRSVYPPLFSQFMSQHTIALISFCLWRLLHIQVPKLTYLLHTPANGERTERITVQKCFLPFKLVFSFLDL